MSKESWIEAFYPVEAARVTIEDAVQHCITKWEGALEENLKAHELTEAPISFHSDTCALCQKYYDAEEEEDEQGPCYKCPLSESRNDVACGDTTKDEKRSPYSNYSMGKNPKPMISALKIALIYENQ
jgi:hypothetical protein